MKRFKLSSRRMHDEEVTFAEVLGSILTSARKHVGLTQKQLAKSADVTQSMMSRVERGKCDVPMSVFNRICEAMQFVPWSLLKAAQDRWDQLE